MTAEIDSAEDARWLALRWNLVPVGSQPVCSGDWIERSVLDTQRWARPVDAA